MEHRDCYNFIHIGLLIRLLRNTRESDRVESIKQCLEYLDDELNDAGLNVTLAFMQGTTYLEALEPLDKIIDGNEKIGQKNSFALSSQFHTIENIIFAEASTKKVYILPTRRFHTEHLLNTPDKLLAEGIFEKLHEIAKSDIRSASRCIIFGESTAAAFHILRATEAVLKQYYHHHRRQNRLPKPMWSNMLDQLKAKPRNKPSPILLNALDIIRQSYRNPTQHPEALYTIDSAQDLFGVCLDAIGKMGAEL